jgi:signal transduction histidine kinase
MEGYRPQARADRLIAVSRLLLAVFGALALLLDPELIPVPLAPPLMVLSIYGVYSLGPLLLGRRAGSPMLRIAQLLIDFIVFCIVIGATHGAVSPFFVFFIFWMFCAMLRFGTRGVVVAAIVTALVYIVLAVSQETIRSDPGYLLLRVTYLAVIALFLMHLARYQQRSGEELFALASWPREVPPRLDDLLTQNVRAAAELMGAPRAAIALEEADEPWTNIAELRDGEVATRRIGPLEETRLQEDERAVPVSGGDLSGQMIFGGAEAWSSDQLALAEIAARLVSSQIEQFAAQEGMRRAAAGEERIRMARDLHDGLLQSLTGVSLQMQTLIRNADDPELAVRLGGLQEIIANEQRELRSLVTQLRPPHGDAAEVPLDLRLRALAERIASQWNVAIDVDVTPPSPELRSDTAAEIYSLMNESLVNAGKHARATHVRARVAIDEQEVRITVEDDGAGFPFTGKYDMAWLQAERRGPRTLKERVAALGGELALESTPAGSRIEMRIEVTGNRRQGTGEPQR